MKTRKVAVPILDDTGLSGKISEHFGHCQLFAIVEINNNSIVGDTIFANPDDHANGCGNLIAHLQKQEVDTVIALGMGAGMFGRCNEQGIKVLLADKERHENANAAINDMLADKLIPMQTLNLCKGSGNCQGHPEIG